MLLFRIHFIKTDTTVKYFGHYAEAFPGLVGAALVFSQGRFLFFQHPEGYYNATYSNHRLKLQKTIAFHSI
jgi:hypothetical protein